MVCYKKKISFKAVFNKKDINFREHEWTKHGTCALILDNVKDEFDYFNVALNLRKKFDFGPILAEQSIIPHDTMLYDMKKIKNAIIFSINK